MAEHIIVPEDPTAKKILSGFKLHSLTLKNFETGERAWESQGWGDEVFTTVKEAHLPARMLQFPAVGREIVFSSVEPIKNFRIEQSILVHGKKIEEWDYDFGFVMPGSENSWETIVEAAGGDQMLPAAFLSGNMLILTSFFSGSTLISRSVVKVFYE